MPKPPPLPRVDEQAEKAQPKPGQRPFAPHATEQGRGVPEVVAVARTSVPMVKESPADPAIVTTTDELIQEPSLLEVFAEELRIKYRLPEDDPTFALMSLFSEVERRELQRQQAFEHFAARSLTEAKTLLEGANELSTTIAVAFQRLDRLDIGVSDVQECVQRFEEYSDSVAEETKPRLIAMAELQSKLEETVFAERKNNLWSKTFNRLLFALALLAGIIIGGGVMHFLH